ncbi:MAG: nitrilase-related carbon-nitrogen hydrolase [Dehalococcoidia bacterium]
MKPYRVALIQQQTHVIVDPKRRNEVIQENLERIFDLLDWTVLRLGGVRLVTFSEYGIIGQYRPRSVEEWLTLAETIPGEVTERIGKKARERGCYIVGNLYERDNDWPGRLFNTSFIVSSEGKVILKYRKNNGPNNLNTIYTGPGDVYSEYVKRYGEDSMFPVAETEIGRLACLTCTDLVFPEMARCLTLRGAEVLIHLTSEPYAPEGEAWDVLRRARAYENLCYFLSVNAGAFVGSNRPTSGYRGMSQIIDYLGHVQSVVSGPGEAVVTGTIDLNSLRWERTRMADSGHVWNFLIELRSDLYGSVYSKAKRWPNDGWRDRKLQSTDETRALAQQIIERLIREGHLIRPE